MKNEKNGRSFAQKLVGIVLALSLVMGLTGTIHGEEIAEDYNNENETEYVLPVTLPAAIDEFEDNEEEEEYPITQVERPETITARPSAHTVLVDGELVAFRAFNINDENFFMLRDIAYTLSGSYNQFEVEWDEELLAISLTTGLTYTLVGGEMSPPEDVDNLADAWLSTASIYVDGESVYLLAYNVGGNNFFRLRDLGEALGFDVDFDEETATVLITTVAPLHYVYYEYAHVEHDEDEDEDNEDEYENGNEEEDDDNEE
ncbi:MAG: copper amine oxidase N-terminal domain-containing protein [Defluviitaleaceae bacterium]|nr:copper amine oxidase N-terminal domain-containing protein [Defluviitaleaceae bacterium]